MSTLKQVFTAEQNAHAARQSQAQAALKRFAAKYPELRILVWTAQNQVIFAEYECIATGKVARAHLNYDGNLIQRL
jgi:hypothetical protein